MIEASRVQKLLTEQNAEIDRLRNRIKKLEAALREMLTKCVWDKREKWCGTIGCHCQIARKALEGKDE
jgi:chromosome condensin MukBEF ATPase and DNA-binding subunit MukB